MGSSRQMMSGGALFAVLVVVALAVATTETEAVTCGDVFRAITPCVQYLQNGSGPPPAPCCQGASALASSVTSKADKQTVCNCLKSAAKNMKVNLQLAKTLPGYCKISFPYPMDPNVDCSTSVRIYIHTYMSYFDCH